VILFGCRAQKPLPHPPPRDLSGVPLVVPDEGPCRDSAISDAIFRAPYVQDVTEQSAALAFADAAPPVADAEFVVRALRGGKKIRVAAEAELFPAEKTGLATAFTLYSARIPELSPGAWYCYEARLGDDYIARGIPFRTAPDPADPAAAVSAVAFGDFGDGSAAEYEVRDAISAELKARPFDLFITLGDNTYREATYADVEGKLFSAYAPLLAQVPMFISLGNHDYGTERAAPTLAAFRQPENAPAGYAERFYSFDYGPVHFVALDSNPEETFPLQAFWLIQDLAANDRPFVVVYFHHPPFSSSRHGSREEVQAAFVPLFDE